MVCIVLVLGMVGFFGLAIVAGVVFLLGGEENRTMPILIASFIAGSALVWFYNTVDICNVSS